MRLLIYLLAMLTGFNAAEAARPVSVTPAELGSAALSTIVVAAVATTRQQNAVFQIAPIPSLATVANQHVVVEPFVASIATVERSDRSRE